MQETSRGVSRRRERKKGTVGEQACRTKNGKGTTGSIEARLGMEGYCRDLHIILYIPNGVPEWTGAYRPVLCHRWELQG